MEGCKTYTFRSDKKLLRRILQNLLSNAIRYARDTEQSRVIIGVRRKSNSAVRIVVVDNGVGIEAEQQQRIFNEFHQVNPSTNNQGLVRFSSVRMGKAV